MINVASVEALDKAYFTDHFKRPLYDTYAFSRIPQTVMRLLTGESHSALAEAAVGGRWTKPEVVVLFLLDGFGWHFFEKYAAQLPFLARLQKEGVISKLSSQFPSTTAAHITTICTGLEVGQTGIYEWYQYEPLVDRMIVPLLYSFAGDHQGGTLSQAPFSPEKIFPFTTLYQRLKQKGVDSYIVQQESIIHSPYSQALFREGIPIAYRTFPEALDRVVDLCKTPRHTPYYLFVYFGEIDAAGHRHGIHSSEFREAVQFCFHALETHYWQPLRDCRKRIATIVTTDHGMTSIDPRTTLYLNKAFPSLPEQLKVNKQGEPLVPAGSCRDFFLHIREEKIEEVHSFLTAQLAGKADVFFVRELIRKGFFGSAAPSERFLERVGNIVILPYPGESVWWYEKHRFEQNFYGAHGGLTPLEMESLFLYIESI